MSTSAFLLAAAATLAGGASPPPAPTPGWPACVERSGPVRTGLRAIRRTRAGRVVTLTLRSRALGAETKVSVLLPRRYDRTGRTRYAVLYALHGAGGDHRTFLDGLRVDRMVGDLPLIVVMPNGSARDARGRPRNGGYVDWFGLAPGEAGPAFAWESFHVRELVPYVDRAFPTRASAAGRAVVGISMGGGGVRYAAKHPGLFGYAGALSGALLTAPTARNCLRPDPALRPVWWRDDSAVDLVENLRGVRLWLRTGDGTPGPLDPPSLEGRADAAVWTRRLQTEAGAHAVHRLMLRALRGARIGADARVYAGSHQQGYWRRELPGFLGWLRRELRRPVPRRRTFRVASAHAAFTAWGWRFSVRRRVREFVYVDVTAARLTARGSGRLVARSPAGRRYVLDLGPSHAREQTDFGAGPGTGRERTSGWRTASVRLR